ncbi:MAG: 5-(carboxyamino)imidazole ribonucleotide mutase [Candidatus Eisenbacteria bacterium]|uniref:N5-carboxyaminoimidazole ribonucleotide mutase n=1 Tax=Eiseniibacteriota bacterium TaxID=2212470 RepID=A0A7Y2H385_UNCEI|nr:5-(carboxyamino)imidazole ribonucleotide mutase [Candidatus Eisenbacteria bacterium]
MAKPLVGVLMGSESDRPRMEGVSKILEELEIPHEVHVMSAHRTPERVAKYATEAEANGIKVLVAGAGMAAHLAGAVAANSLLPVIGVPLDASALNGMDALLATVQMPPEIPVATVAIGNAGAKNAGHLAARILALGDPEIRQRLGARREKIRG